MRTFVARAALGALVSLVVADLADAAGEEEPITLAEALRAVEEAPAGRLAELTAALGRAGRVGAGAWTNPSLGYTGYLRAQGTPEAINGQQHQLQLTVELPLAGAPAARVHAADAARDAAAADAEVLRRRAELAAGTAWADLRAADERVTLGREARERLAEAARIAAARADLGAARRYEAQRVATDLARLDREVAVAVAERDAASALLGGLLGRPGIELRASGPGTAGTLPDPGAFDPDSAPAVLAAERRGEAASWRRSAERRAAVPSPQLTGGAYWTVDGTSSSGLFGLALPLPVGDRNRQAVALAGVEVDRAEAEAAWARAEVGATWAALARREEALAGALAAIDGGSVRAAAAARDTALLGWREGALGFVEWLDAERAWADAVEERIAVARELDVVRLSQALLARPGGAEATR